MEVSEENVTNYWFWLLYLFYLLYLERTYISEFLAEAEYLSVDPYMRAYMIGYKLPADMIGGQVAK